jgi:hypothetical protein
LAIKKGRKITLRDFINGVLKVYFLISIFEVYVVESAIQWNLFMNSNIHTNYTSAVGWMRWSSILYYPLSAKENMTYIIVTIAIFTFIFIYGLAGCVVLIGRYREKDFFLSRVTKLYIAIVLLGSCLNLGLEFLDSGKNKAAILMWIVSFVGTLLVLWRRMLARKE